MNKRLILPLLLLVFMLSACTDEDPNYTYMDVGETSNYQMDEQKVTIIRSDMFDLTDANALILINDVESLKQYYRPVDMPFNETLFDYLTDIDETFFETKSLIIIGLTEPSGSIRHKVSNIEITEDRALLEINRNVPEIGTTDMAGWHIIIELPKIDSADVDISNIN